MTPLKRTLAPSSSSAVQVAIAVSLTSGATRVPVAAAIFCVEWVVAALHRKSAEKAYRQGRRTHEEKVTQLRDLRAGVLTHERREKAKTTAANERRRCAAAVDEILLAGHWARVNCYLEPSGERTADSWISPRTPASGVSFA